MTTMSTNGPTDDLDSSGRRVGLAARRGLLICGLAAVGWVGATTASSVADARAEIERLRGVYFLQGHLVPDITLEDTRGIPVRLAPVTRSGVTVLWIVSQHDCLACLGESAALKDLVRRYPSINVAMIGVQGERTFFQELKSSQELPFTLLRDANGMLLASLGLPMRTPYKLLSLDGVILSAERGTLPTDIGFTERVELLARYGAMADRRASISAR